MKFITGRCMSLQLINLCDQEPYVYDFDISPITELVSCITSGLLARPAANRAICMEREEYYCCFLVSFLHVVEV